MAVQAYDLNEIVAKGELTAVTLNTSTSYFIYKMQQMGYEYELIDDFASSMGLKLNIIVAENITRLEYFLRNGQADIVAYPIQMDNAMKDNYLFCGVESQDHLVIVQRSDKEDSVLQNVTELIGKEVWVNSASRFYDRLVNLNNELGGGIIIREIERDTVTVEDLIGMVAQGSIPFTVSDNNLAKLNQTYYHNINIKLSISFPQRSSWIVRKKCPALAKAVNDWATTVSKNKIIQSVSKRYFEISKTDEYSQEGLIIQKGHISPYDSLFRQYADSIGWDWRLLASIAWQESKFRNRLESWAGARGLMGIMPRTARNIGFEPDSLYNPETSIYAGVRCLSLFKDYYPEIKNHEEKIKFTLAAYNAGNGHIHDARKLALKYGKNPNVWDENVAHFIRLKSEPFYYKDTVCDFGYLRGEETYRYVKEILSRYNSYKMLIINPD